MISLEKIIEEIGNAVNQTISKDYEITIADESVKNIVLKLQYGKKFKNTTLIFINKKAELVSQGFIMI